LNPPYPGGFFYVLYFAIRPGFLCTMAGEKQLTKAQVADAWAKFTIKEWRSKLTKLKAADSGQLWMSFVSNVINQANGDVLKIEFAFKYYGKFVDMGVGKGVPIGGVKEAATARRLEGKMLGNRRKPRKWYSKTLSHEVKRLAEIMAEEYGHTAALQIKEIIENQMK
jgi:hypothetical protein